MVSKAFIVRKFRGEMDERCVRDLFPNEPVVLDVFDREKVRFKKNTLNQTMV